MRTTDRQRPGGWWWRLLLAAAVLLASMPASMAAPQGAEERGQLEGAFLVNFVRFTQWPATSFANPRSPYIIAVVGSHDAAAAVRSVARAAGHVHGRPIEVLRVRGSDVDRHRALLRASHLVYLDRTAGVPAAELVALVDGAPVLTVGDSAGFVQAGGMLGLQASGRRMAFVANAEAIRRSQVDVSAKVLSLAQGTRP